MLTPLRLSYVKVDQEASRMVGLDHVAGSRIPSAERLHLCTAHWPQKQASKSRMPIGNMTYTWTVKDFYEPINHPTIDDIALMILSLIREYGASQSGRE
jgi:hypothetical protein